MMEPVENTHTHDSTAPDDAPLKFDSPPLTKATPWLGRILSTINSYEVSHQTSIIFFTFIGICVALIPLKEFYLGSYVTKTFDEVRYDAVARQLSTIGVVTSGVQYHDTFHHSHIKVIDSETKSEFERGSTSALSLSSFLQRANIRRVDLLDNLPESTLNMSVDTMNDVHAPLCGPDSSFWESPPQLLFGNWFPTIRHEFCRDFHKQFPRDRFFNHNTSAPIDSHLADVGKVTLGLIAVVNMSEVYLRQFTDDLVIRKIMKSVQEGFLDIDLPNYTDTVAEAIVERYQKGIPLADVVRLLPGSIDSEHVALVDILGIDAIREFYLGSQQLTMGVNINTEAAILAEVTHATASYMTSDFIINTVGMHYVSTVHLAPFWACAIKHTTMAKDITVDDVDAAAIKQCGSDLAPTLPVFIVNLMYLFQSDQRDYAKIDNSTVYTLGRRRESDADYVPLVVPETFDGSSLLCMDGSAWTKERVNTSLSLQETPYGYLYTADCRNLVDKAMQQTGRNVQKYQAYLGDGLGNCAYRDSQETTPQTLCRLFMTGDELLFRSLDGSLLSVPTCTSLLPTGASDATLALEQENLRQVEWFMIDTTMVDRQVRIQDNTSRQIRTFLLLLNLLGATFYSLHYLVILRNVWTFISNSVYRPAAEISRFESAGGSKYNIQPPARIGIVDLLQCDPADGALLHPATMALLYLGAVGALSNIFSLSCSSELSATEGAVVIHCVPSIPLSSRSLVFTTLSSSYWVIRISLQTRSLAVRLTHAARPDLPRFWLINFIAVLAIHFICKSGADQIFQNAELRIDPHLCAMFASFSLTLVISIVSVLAQAIAIAAQRGSRRRGLGILKRLSGNTTRILAIARAASERKFTALWSRYELDSVLNHCATPQIARQLEFSRRRRVWGQSQSKLIVDPAAGGQDTPIHIQEFVVVHCAAGAHAHLQHIRWGADGGVTGVDGVRNPKHVYTAKITGDSNSIHRRESL